MSTRHRRPIAGLILALLLVGSAGCVPASQGGSAPTTAPPAGAAAELATLTVSSWRPMRGYSRAHFPHWRQLGANCDVRDAVLKRDARSVRVSGCNVVGGSWLSPYDGRTVAGPSAMDIDHMVPLANAWRSGADTWTDDKRGDFANDLTRPQLIAVTLTTNRSKGDQDPSTWKPPNHDYWCRYAQDWIAVKSYWRLSVTAAEKAALTDMLRTCS